MPYKYIILKPDGTRTCESHKKTPGYQEVQKIVGGLMQIIPYFSSLEHEGVKYSRGTAYCNEESWTLGLQRNPQATEAWMKACPKGDPKRMLLEGNILFVVKEKVNAETS